MSLSFRFGRVHRGGAENIGATEAQIHCVKRGVGLVELPAGAGGTGSRADRSGGGWMVRNDDCRPV